MYERRSTEMYRFLRVNEANLTVTQLVYFPCCGAKRYLHALGEETICIACAMPIKGDPHTAPLEMEKDLKNFRHLKVSRYVLS